MSVVMEMKLQFTIESKVNYENLNGTYYRDS